jgi:F0F1-type ATP synthase assembly protein I
MGHLFALAQIGAEMAAPIGLGVLADVYLRTMPWGIIVGAVLGFVGGLLHLLHLVNRQDRDDPSKKAKDSR